jgi:hypothetical protein
MASRLLYLSLARSFFLELRLLSSRSFPPIGGVDGVRARKAAGRNRAGDVFERVVCFHQMRGERVHQPRPHRRVGNGRRDPYEVVTDMLGAAEHLGDQKGAPEA